MLLDRGKRNRKLHLMLPLLVLHGRKHGRQVQVLLALLLLHRHEHGGQVLMDDPQLISEDCRQVLLDPWSRLRGPHHVRLRGGRHHGS